MQFGFKLSRKVAWMPVRNKLKAVLVGVGPGASTLVTPEAREIILKAEIILGWDMDLLPVRDCVAGKKVFLQDVRNYVQATRAAVREAKRTRKQIGRASCRERV